MAISKARLILRSLLKKLWLEAFKKGSKSKLILEGSGDYWRYLIPFY